MSPYLAPSPVGWVFRIAQPKQKLPDDGAKAHLVADVNAAHAFYREAGGSIPRDEFVARLWGYDAKAGTPTKPLTAPPTEHATVFCLPLLPATSAPGAPPIPVVAADGPYPPELVELAKKHRPVFHLPEGVSIGDASAVFEAVGIKGAEALYPDAPKSSPEAVKLPTAGQPVVYGHVLVRRAGKVARAFAQFYVLLLIKGKPKSEPRGGWQFVQVEFVKGPKDKEYRPVTVGCSTRTGGHVRFFDIDAWLPCHSNGIHPGASASGGFAVLEGQRPKVFAAPDGESLFLGPGGWAPAGDEPKEDVAVRLEHEVVAAPDHFHELYPFVAPVWIDEQKGIKHDTPKELPFLLSAPSWQVFWLGWAGNYGYHLGARPGPKYLAPPRPPGAEISLSGPGVRTELLWWGHPDRFQEEYLRATRGPRSVRAVTVSLNGAGDFRAKVLPGDRPPPPNGDVEYVPVAPVASGKTLAAELSRTGELYLARVTPPPEPPGRGATPPPLVALARQTRVALPPMNGFICFHLKDTELQEVVNRLADPQRHEWVALLLRVSEQWLKAGSSTDAPLQSWLDESAVGRRPIHTLFGAQARVSEAFCRSAKWLDDEARNVIIGFFSPMNLGIMGLMTFGGVAAFLLQGTPVGWALDVILIGVGFVFVGMQVADGLDRLASGLFLAQLASTEMELDLAAQHLAAAVILLGLGVIMAWAGGKQMSRAMKYSEAKPVGSGAKLLEYLLRKPFQKLLREAVTKSKKAADLHAVVAKRPNSVFDKTMSAEQIKAVAHEIVDSAKSEGVIREVVPEGAAGKDAHTIIIEAADARGRGVRFKRPKGGEPEFVGFYEDVAVPINEKHIFSGEVKGSNAGGFHHRPDGKNVPTAKVVRGSESAQGAHGVYKAKVKVRKTPTDPWVEKTLESTFFPDDWSQAKVLSEIRGAFRNRTPTPHKPASVYWEGVSPSGVKIQGWFDHHGNINTAWPVWQ